MQPNAFAALAYGYKLPGPARWDALLLCLLPLGPGGVKTRSASPQTQPYVDRPAAPQIFQGSLAALCDDPLSVSNGQDWAAVGQRVRVPIFVTANDLSLLYAPLVRDGRMDKFYFEPSRQEMAGMVGRLFAPHLCPEEVSGQRAEGAEVGRWFCRGGLGSEAYARC